MSHLRRTSPSELEERRKEKAELELSIHELESEASISHARHVAQIIKDMTILTSSHLAGVSKSRRDVETALKRQMKEKQAIATADEILMNLKTTVRETVKPAIDVELYGKHTTSLCVYAAQENHDTLQVPVQQYSNKLQTMLGMTPDEADTAAGVALRAFICERRWQSLIDQRERALGNMIVEADRLVLAYSSRGTLDISAWLDTSTTTASAVAANLRILAAGHITHLEMSEIDQGLEAARTGHGRFAERITAQLQTLQKLELVIQALRDEKKKQQQQANRDDDLLFQRAQERERKRQGKL